MKKTKWFAISLIALIVFNVIAFAVPLDKTPTFWIGYAFGTIAIILELLVNQKVQAADKELKSRFYGWSLMIVASVYMTVQIILSLLFMVASSIYVWVALIVCVVCLALCGVGLIAGESAKEIIEQIDVKVKQKVFYIKSLESDLRLLSSSCSDVIAKKNIIALADAIRFSDPMSSDTLSDIEQEIAERCRKIKALVESCQYNAMNEEYSHTMKLLAERNEKCKLLK